MHLDAHHDLWRAPDASALSIANFLSIALLEGVVRELYWVVPDPTFDDGAGRAAVGAHLRALGRQYAQPAPPRWEPGRVRTTLLGCPVTVCALRSVPNIAEPVLLDVDVDYLLIPRVAFGEWDRHTALPWHWPAELAPKLATLRPELVTIAYSVNGGYTPMRWKYLGVELAARLGGGAGTSEQELRAFDQMRAAAEAELGGDPLMAEQRYLAAADAVGAAAWFSLAHLLAARGRLDEARAHLARARELDPSYRTPYSSPGLALFRRGSRRAAARAFERTLQIDAGDPVPHVGLGWLAAGRRRWPAAEACARQALVLRPDLIDAHRLLAEALSRQGRIPEAIAACEQSLKLALAGQRPLNAVIASHASEGRLLDVDHAKAHADLARLHERMRDRRRALAGYRIALAGGYAPPGVQFGLARVLARERQWTAAARHALTGAIGAPAAAAAWIGRAYRRWRLSRNDHDA